jgi:hypothetical protein
MEYGGNNRQRPRKVLLLSDGGCETVFNDMLQKHYARKRSHEAIEGILVGCGQNAENSATATNGAIMLPSIYAFEMPFGAQNLLQVPSLLNAIKRICKSDPDEIAVTSPGPLGMLGLLAAKLLHVPCTGIYGMGPQFNAGTGEAAQLIDRYVDWFYSMTDFQIEGLPTAAELSPCNPFPPDPGPQMPAIGTQVASADITMQAIST